MFLRALPVLIIGLPAWLYLVFDLAWTRFRKCALPRVVLDACLSLLPEPGLRTQDAHIHAVQDHKLRALGPWL